MKALYVDDSVSSHGVSGIPNDFLPKVFFLYGSLLKMDLNHHN